MNSNKTHFGICFFMICLMFSSLSLISCSSTSNESEDSGNSLFTALILKAINEPMAPSNYTETVKTGGEIEAKYLALGDSQVEYVTRKGSSVTKKFCIYYPAGLTESKYPVVIMLNGTGVLPYKYKSVFQHMASWGFIVVGSDDDSSGFGKSADESVDLLYKENTDPESIFFGKIDTSNLGIAGHSQGGAGVLTALSIMNHKNSFKTAVSLSPTYEEMSIKLGWKYDLTQINTPLLLLAGTKGSFETEFVIPFEKMLQMFGKIPAEKRMARRTGAEHGQMLYSADGYVTAWFMWYLKNDEYAARAFCGETPELSVNKLYSDFQ